jgi:uncharacterized repeat protein (TIGR03803 family)
MNSPRRWSLALAYALGITSACAQSYVATDLSATNSAPTNYTPTAVNGLMAPYQVGSGRVNGLSVALFWNGSAASVQNLTPAAYRAAAMYSFSSIGPVGYGVTTAGQTQALYWPSPTPNAQNINPVINGTNATFSEALGVSGTQIVGEGGSSPTNAYYAVLWPTPGTNVIDLHPSGYSVSSAVATDGRQEVGYAITNNNPHAIIWSGGPSTAQDLNPSGNSQSYATAVASQPGSTNSIAVGYALPTTNASYYHAYAWPSNGTTNFPVSLHPAGFLGSYAYGIASTNVVGYGITSTGAQVALLWPNYAATNVVNLSAYLPTGATNAVATCIDSSGNIGGYANIPPTFQNHAILWQPTRAPVFTSSTQTVTTGLNVPYSFTYTATGIPNPGFTTTNAPPGLTLFPTGTFSGTPTATGTFTGTIMATNGISPNALQSYSITVVPTPTNQVSTVGNFVEADGGGTFSPLCRDPVGNFYATAQNGGPAFEGALVEMQTNGAESVLHSFADGSVTNDGAQPMSVITGPNGALYGTTFNGGGQGYGVLFTYSSGTYSVLHRFEDGSVPNDGGYPWPSLLAANDGNVYGVTAVGGTANNGTAFKITPTGTETILHSFRGGGNTNDGYDPQSPLVQGSDGNFYGTTLEGGSTTGGGTGYGSAFQMTPTGSVTILHAFANGSLTNDGRNPVTGLTEGLDGNFYGMTLNGGTTGEGTIYRVSPSGQFSILRNIGDGTVADDIFLSRTVTSIPQQNLVQGPDGNFYGVTEYGGSANKGALFMMNPSGLVVVLHNFGDGSLPNEGYYPNGNLYLAADGNYYGATESGGANGYGTIYKFVVSSAPVLASGSPLPPTALLGQAFNYQFSALGSPAPTFSSTGNLPPGLTLATDGLLSGTPNADGTYTFTVIASNGVGSPVSQNVTLVITGLPTDTPVMPPWGLALFALLLLLAAIIKPSAPAQS